MAKQRIIPIVYKVDYSQVDKSTASVKKAEQATDKLNKEIKETENGVGKAFVGLKNAIVATGIVTILGTVAKKIFDIGVSAEQTTIAFNTFLGSASKARLLLADLTKFAIVTPFTPDQVNSAAKALLAFGVKAKEIIPTLKMLGDVSAGTGKDLTDMAVIFGQIRSTGRLMGQDLLQLINAGFNPLQIISEKTGKSVTVLKQEMEKGLISFQMVSDAFKTATSEGGLFFNLMEKQSQTIGGKLSTVAGNIEEVFKNIFNATSGPLADFVDKLGTISEAFLLMSKSTEQLGQEIADIKLERFRKRLSQIEDQLKSNNKAIQDNAITLQNSFAVDVVDAINDVSVELQELEGEFVKNKEEVSKAVSDGNKVAISETQKNTKELYLRKEALEAEKDGLIEVRDELFKLTKAEKSTGDEVKLTNEQLAKRAAALKKINEQLGFTTGSDKFKENQKADDLEAQRQSDAIDREIEQDKRRADVLKANNADMEAEKTRIAEEEADKRIKIAQEEAANKIAAQEAAFDFAVDAIGSILIAENDSYSESSEALREKYDRELMLAGDNQKAKEQIEIRREQEEKKLRLKQVEDEKKQNTRRILIETVLNAVKALGLPPIPGANFVAAAKASAYGLLAAGIARRYSKGSEVGIDGPGTTKSDSIPAMLSKGETVMSYEQTTASRGILKAIKAKKLDDRLLEKLYKKAGSGGDGVAFSDERIVQGLSRLQPDDVIKKGSYLFDVKRKNADSVAYVRRKYIH